METELCTEFGDDLATIDCALDLSETSGIRSALHHAQNLIHRCDSLLGQLGSTCLTMQEHADLLILIPLDDFEKRDDAYAHVLDAEHTYNSLLQKMNDMIAELEQAQYRLRGALSTLQSELPEPERERIRTSIERFSHPLSLAQFEEENHRVADALSSWGIALVTWDHLPDPPVVSRPQITAAPSQPKETPPSIHESEPVEEQRLEVPKNVTAATDWLTEAIVEVRDAVRPIIFCNQHKDCAAEEALHAAEALRDLPMDDDDENGKDQVNEMGKPIITTREQAHTMLQRAEATYHRLTRQIAEGAGTIVCAQRTLRQRIQAILASPFLDDQSDAGKYKRKTLTDLLPFLRETIDQNHLQTILQGANLFLAQLRFSPTTVMHRASTEHKEKIQAHIRPMTRRDMPEVLGIEAESFEFPWLEEDFIRCLKQRNCIGMVAECDDRVVGFMIFELNKTRIHVLNFAVAAGERRRGVASQMLKKLVDKLSYQRRSRITLEVRDTNIAAQLCFQKNGFRATSVLRNFYEDTPEDAYLMQYTYH